MTRAFRIKLLCVAFFLLLITNAFYVNDIYAAILPEKIRIGLETKYKESATISIASTAIMFGFEVNGTFAGGGQLTNSAGFEATLPAAFYVKTPQPYQSFEQARTAALALGSGACPAMIDVNNFAVYIPAASQGEAQMLTQVYAGQIATDGKKRVLITALNAPAVVFDSPTLFPQITGADGQTAIGDRKYRGVIELTRPTGKNITPVNILPVNEYLYSAVASEIPNTWHVEALKAQAVAARSYTYKRQNSHAKDGYNLCDRSHCQQYIGITSEKPETTRAVTDTGMTMAYYNNEPIDGVYFSSSGGYTDDSENVWNEAVPYLRAVKEVNEKQAKVWTRTFSLSDIDTLLSKNGINIGQTVSLTVSNKSPSGRVDSLTIKGSTGSKTLIKEDIRTFFSASSGGTLESRNFKLTNGTTTQISTPAVNTAAPTPPKVFAVDINGAAEYGVNGLFAVSKDGIVTQLSQIYAVGLNSTFTYQNTVTPALPSTATVSSGSRIVFSGSGWGHGVGMSQYGAKGMAEIGYSFVQILQHFYVGTEVR